MIASYRCDRCGREFQQKGIGYQFYPVETDTSAPRVTKYGHLCKGCRDEFFGWLMSVHQTPVTGLVPDGHGSFRWAPATQKEDEE